MAGLYFEDFEVGRKFKTGGRTVTAGDVQAFAEVARDFHPLHLDEDYAKKSPFGRRIAHGLLGLTVASGLSQALGHLEGTFLAFLGLEWTYKVPIYIGDTVHEEQTVLSRRETKDPSRGVIVIGCRLVNQKGEVVQEGKRTIMVARKETED
jgi:acyl dehydratase